MIARRFIAIVLPLLLGAEPPTPLPVTRITLDDRPRKLVDIAAELARQSNIPIDVSRVAPEKTLRLRLDGVPFWEAVDRLARAGDQRISIAPQGNRVTFEQGSYSAVPTSVSGPFCFVAKTVLGRLDLETGVSKHEIQIDMAWEPTFKAYYTELDPQSLRAIGSDGKPLTMVNEGATRTPVTDASSQLSIKLRGVARSENKIAQLDGMVKFLGTSQMLQFSFDLGAEPTPLQRAEVTAKLTSIQKNVRIWTAVVELQYPRDMPEFESFQSFLLDNEAWLLRADGTKFPIKHFELGFENQGKIPISYFIAESEKDGLTLSDRSKWKLVVRVPGRIVEQRVPFHLKDIALP
jgi:hypothetical protein